MATSEYSLMDSADLKPPSLVSHIQEHSLLSFLVLAQPHDYILPNQDSAVSTYGPKLCLIHKLMAYVYLLHGR